jgi:sodium-dependent dicarboxylate transporter 2/3/5
MLLLICLIVTFLTEVTSNTATASLLMPLLAAAALAMDINPMLLMIPAALSASCAFMLPVATAPNAVMYGSGRVTIREMARAGLVLNLLGVVVISSVSYWLLT